MTKNRRMAYFILAFIGMAACADDELVLRGFTMGSNYTIRIHAPPAGTNPDDVRAAVDALLDGITLRMSHWDPGAEVARFNARGDLASMEFSPETIFVLDQAFRMSQATGGAFDPTIPPLSRLWGFGPGARDGKHRPAPAQITGAMRTVGFTRLKLDGRRLRRATQGVEIDLSAIAPGYAADQVYGLLARRGMTAAMVDISGEVRVGPGPGGRPWRIGLERPNYDGGSEIYSVVELENMAVASSGDYRNYFEIDGKRYAHIIDPRTGEPAASRVAATTVVGPDAMTCDALATSLMVLGATRGLELCARYRGFECLLLVRRENVSDTNDPDAFEQVLSPGMRRYLRAD